MQPVRRCIVEVSLRCWWPKDCTKYFFFIGKREKTLCINQANSSSYHSYSYNYWFNNNRIFTCTCNASSRWVIHYTSTVQWNTGKTCNICLPSTIIHTSTLRLDAWDNFVTSHVTLVTSFRSWMVCSLNDAMWWSWTPTKLNWLESEQGYLNFIKNQCPNHSLVRSSTIWNHTPNKTTTCNDYK